MLVNGSNYFALIGGSHLIGATSNGGAGTLKCAGVYDLNYNFLASTCQ